MRADLRRALAWPALGAYLVVGDRFLLSQWTASKKAAFQNLSECLRTRGTM